MKVPRFLKTLMAVFVCLALIRAVNGAGPLSLTDLLLKIQEFDFSFEPITTLIDNVKQSSFDTPGDAIQSVLSAIGGFFKMLFELVKSMFALAGDLFGFVFYVAGFTS